MTFLKYFQNFKREEEMSPANSHHDPLQLWSQTCSKPRCPTESEYSAVNLPTAVGCTQFYSDVSFKESEMVHWRDKAA
jgi:hypothetical protein